MIATLEFDLPEEKNEFILAQRGLDYWSVLWDLKTELQNKKDFAHNFKDADECIEWVLDYLYDSINFDEVE